MTDVNWELEDDAPVWCDQCEHWSDDCVCEELCDHIRETITEPLLHG